MIKFYRRKTYKKEAEAIAREITKKINDGKKVLWIVSGGSNIPIAVEIASRLKTDRKIEKNKNGRLSIVLSDERYGTPHHKDSNWKQLRDFVKDFSLSQDDFKIEPILIGKSPQVTVRKYETKLEKFFRYADFIIGQFGIGTDGHIAGILPKSQASRAKGLVHYYNALKFKRVTMTFKALRKTDRAYLFALGKEKRMIVEKLKKEVSRKSLGPLGSLEGDPVDFPAKIIAHIPYVSVYY